VEAGDAGVGLLDHLRQAIQQLVGLELLRQEARDPAALVADEARRLGHPDLHRDPDELRVIHAAGQADPDRQRHPASADGTDPPGDRGGVEAELAHDVRGHLGLD